MTAEEAYGALKSYVKRLISSATISTVQVSQTISSGNEIASIDVSGTATKVYMPSVKVNGVTQNIASNEMDLDVASNLITDAQWAQIEAVI